VDVRTYVLTLRLKRSLYIHLVFFFSKLLHISLAKFWNIPEFISKEFLLHLHMSFNFSFGSAVFQSFSFFRDNQKRLVVAIQT